MQHTAPTPDLIPSQRCDLRHVPPSELHPDPVNLRGPVERDEELEELAGSMRSLGVLEPLVARQVDGKLVLVAGHRRHAAAQIAELVEVPVIVRDLTDFQVVEGMLAENTLRENLRPEQEAHGYKILIESGRYTVESLAKRCGVSTSRVYRILQFTEDGPELLEAVSSGVLPPSVADVVRGTAKATKTRPQVVLNCMRAEHPNTELTAKQVRAFCKLYKARFDEREAEANKEYLAPYTPSQDASLEEERERQAKDEAELDKQSARFAALTLGDKLNVLLGEYGRTREQGADLELIFWEGILNQVFGFAWYKDPEALTGKSAKETAERFRAAISALEKPQRKRKAKGKASK